MKMLLKKIIEECAKKHYIDEKKLAAIKRKAVRENQKETVIPSNVSLLKVYHELLKNGSIKRNKNIEKILIKRKIRSLSGVIVVSALTKPYPCPGKCIYCPTEKGLPKSYLSGEPAVERAKRFNFNPYSQVQKRIESLKEQGHPTDKIELRIIGGSWSAYEKNYQLWFIAECFRAANHSKTKPFEINFYKELEKEQKKNEKSKNRIVGISIETRPDLINKKEILNLRKLGVTMVELGVQSVFDNVLKKCRRDHNVKATIKATKLLKDAGFKIMYQIMPNLPGSNEKKDIESLKKVFENQDFKPDWLKIYPCVVCKNSELYQIWKKGNYKPYSCEKLISLLIKIKKQTPYFIRIARLFRDIPAQKIEAGCKTSNLREIIQKKMKKRNIKCHCIRCREVKENYKREEKIYLKRENYSASNGKEILLSFENKKRTKLLSYLRLRIPSGYFDKKPCPAKILKDAAIIREIHTFGKAVSLGKKTLAPQHQGLGKKLIKEAEEITKKEFHLKKIAAISGIGARGYWQKLNYQLKDTYMAKRL